MRAQPSLPPAPGCCAHCENRQARRRFRAGMRAALRARECVICGAAVDEAAVSRLVERAATGCAFCGGGGVEILSWRDECFCGAPVEAVQWVVIAIAALPAGDC